MLLERADGAERLVADLALRAALAVHPSHVHLERAQARVPVRAQRAREVAVLALLVLLEKDRKERQNVLRRLEEI